MTSRHAANAEATESRVRELLQSPSFYPESPGRVELRETHISSVYLTGQFAYKLKKPVDFGFVNFGTLPLRKAACEDEVRLNRRLAPDVYLGVHPITLDSDGTIQLDGPGEPIEWLVKMKRLADGDALSALIAGGRVTESQVDRLCERLFDFYERVARIPLAPDEYAAHVRQHVSDNWDALRAAAEDRRSEAERAAVDRTHAAQWRLLTIAPDLLAARVREARVLDGHGDLRPEHVYFTPDPKVIDCIEFNEEFRQMDVLDELAFLAEECEQLGAGWIGERIIRRCREDWGDDYPRSLLEFYKAYRACVRAKVASLRAAQVPPDRRCELHDEADRCLELAESHSRGIAQPFALVVFGLSGTGKSTLAGRLAEQLRVRVLSTDHIRRSHQTVPLSADSPGARALLYRPEERLRIYGEMIRGAGEALRMGESVILDGTFAGAEMRNAVVETAANQRAAVLFVECVCEQETALRRIRQRAVEGQSESDATENVYLRQVEDFVPLAADLPVLQATMEDESLPSAADAVVRQLRARLPWT